jgi:ubiquitin thioesterase ZRANB1
MFMFIFADVLINQSFNIMSDMARKWSCEYCTYENWPASKKCVLCRAPKPMQFIDEEALPAEQDIYKIAPLICPPDTSPSRADRIGCLSVETNDTRHSPCADLGTKWSCQMCTYLNWPKAVRCTQCSTPKSKQCSPTASVSCSIAQPLNVDVNSPPAATSSTSHNSPSSPEAAKATNNDKNRPSAILPVTSSTTTTKWSCRACTYDNWPRAQSCVLCGLSRGDKTGAPAAADRESANHRGITSSVMRRRSPPTSASSRGSSLDSIESLYTASNAVACPSSNQQHDRLIGTAIEINAAAGRTGAKMRQIRNRLRDIDWLWLTACQGVVEGDVHAVESYLAAGGDPSRQISAEESTLLGRTSTFAPGHSLVHLAIRFRREDMLSTLLDVSEVAASKSRKRVPSYAAPDVAAAIVREIGSSLRQRKGDFPCYFLMEISTFALPAGMFLLTIWLYVTGRFLTVLTIS